MALEFEWDRRKATANQRKHGVSFEEAASMFGEPLSLTIGDPGHSANEDRFVTIGISARGRTNVVAHTDRGDRIRIISARVATRREQTQYEEAD